MSTLTRQQVAERICEGQVLIIYRSQVLNATKWASHHPGGALALLHFVGRDATDEIDAYHSESAKKRMTRMVVGQVEVDDKVGWRPLNPPISLGLLHCNGKWVREGEVKLGRGIGLDVTPAQLEPESGLNLDVERVRSKAYQGLRQRIIDAGLFRRPGPLAGYGSDLVRYALLGFLAFYLYFRSAPPFTSQNP
jgi:delta8-fatty-acid desaturase